MSNWETILRFDLPHQAHMAKTKLESEGIVAIIENELSGQVYNVIRTSSVIKLLVQLDDYDRAFQILSEGGFIEEPKAKSHFIQKIDKLTAQIPILGKTVLEFRIIVILATLIMMLVLPFIL